MNSFFIKLFLFTFILIIILSLCNILVPARVLVYRPWEALVFSNISANSPFYPNTKFSMNSVGDLCHHTTKSIVKNEYWQTDRLGFRNNQFINDASVIIIGDSFIAGSSLHQSNTICNQISKIDKSLKIYNMAPSSVSHFDKFLKTGVISKPKILIFSQVERSVPEQLQLYNPNVLSEIFTNNISSSNFTSHIDYFFKFLPLKWGRARLKGITGDGIQGANNSKMYFFQGSALKRQKNDLINTVNTLKSYKRYCDSLGITFVYMPMPNKETVYYDLVPLKSQPDYLLQLDSLLSISGIITINTLNTYNVYRRTNNHLLYHLDDTHWNETATKLVAMEIVKSVKMQLNISVKSTSSFVRKVRKNKSSK